MAKAPPIVPRPGLYRYISDRGLRYRDCAGPLECSHEHVRQLCLPFGDPKRVEPSEADLDHLWRWTDGEITRADFDPPPEPALVPEAAL